MKISVRNYQEDDAKDLASIYYYTIHKINVRDYTKEQIEVWAPKESLNIETWSKKFEKTKPLVAVANETIVGFAEFEPNGHIDCFYCHHEWIGLGVGSALMKAIDKIAKEQNLLKIFVEVSITARPFFEKQGFKVVKEQQVSLKGIKLTNFVMEKVLE